MAIKTFYFQNITGTLTLQSEAVSLQSGTIPKIDADGMLTNFDFVQGDIIYASATNTVANLAKDANATRYLANTGTSNNPQWNQVNLVDGITNTLAILNGGTGQSNSNSAVNALLPAQGGNAGKYLKTDATDTSWDTPAGVTNHALLSNLNWAAAGHTIDTTFDIGDNVLLLGLLGDANGVRLSYDGANALFQNRGGTVYRGIRAGVATLDGMITLDSCYSYWGANYDGYLTAVSPNFTIGNQTQDGDILIKFKDAAVVKTLTLDASENTFDLGDTILKINELNAICNEEDVITYNDDLVFT